MPRVLSPQHPKAFKRPADIKPSVKKEHAHVCLEDLPCPCLAYFGKPPGFRKAFASEYGAGEFDVAGLLFWLAHDASPQCIVVC